MTIVLLFFMVVSTLFAQVDRNASSEVRELYKRLNDVSLSINTNQKILLGQQNAFMEGRGWRYGNQEIGLDLKSDMNEVAGLHPIVYGIDFSEIGQWNKELIKSQIEMVHKKGGVITLSWHMRALIDDGKGDQSSKDKSTKIVHRIIKGGDHHHVLLKELDRLIEFLKEIQNIPVIFRPWHEHNYSWFWWGKNHCKKQDFIQLWQTTSDYLKNQGVHNLLYAYSPTQIESNYLDRYPGDNFVDILGVDHYFYNKIYDLALIGLNPLKKYKEGIIWLCEESVRRNKIPAITEFGQESSHYSRFWTDYFGEPLMKESMEKLTATREAPKKGPAYIMLWRNDQSDPKHYYGPVPGHKNNDNFKELLDTGIFQGL
jgi:mannan endo-1,4-beta-mannosidase